MGKFKNALRVAGEVATAMAENERKIDELTDLLVRKTYGGVDRDQAKKIARVLITQADITWK